MCVPPHLDLFFILNCRGEADGGVAHEWECPQRPEEGVRSPETGITDSCELPDMHAGNETLVPRKSAMHS